MKAFLLSAAVILPSMVAIILAIDRAGCERPRAPLSAGVLWCRIRYWIVKPRNRRIV